MKTSLCGHNYTNFAHSIGLLLLETYFPGKTSQQSIDTALFQPERRSAELRASWLEGYKSPDEKVVLLYAGRISCLRYTMEQAALNEAQQRFWPAAMQHLFDGYQEVIMDARALAAA